MLNNLILKNPNVTNDSYEVTKKNGATILEEKSNHSRTYVGQFSSLNELDPQELQSLNRIWLTNAFPQLDADWCTLEQSIYFQREKGDALPELEDFMSILRQYPNIHELRIPTCYIYSDIFYNGISGGKYVSPLFNELDKIPSLTTLHINWTDFNWTNSYGNQRKTVIERLSKNPHLREVHFYQGIYVHTDYGIKKLSRNDISYLTKLREIPENERPQELSNANIASFIQKMQIDNGAIRQLRELYQTKQPMAPELVYSLKKLFEVPLDDNLVEPLTDCAKTRKTDLKIFLHGIKIDDNQTRILTQAVGQSNHVSIYAQNTTLAPAPQNSTYLISRDKPNNAAQQNATQAEKKKYYFF
jgi:hypothetical protein